VATAAEVATFVWLMLLQLSLLLLGGGLLLPLQAELLSLPLGLQLLPVWMLVLLLLLLGLLLLSLLSFSPPRSPSCVFTIFASERVVKSAYCPAHADVEDWCRRSRCTRPSAYLKNQSGPGTFSNALLIWCQEAQDSPTKSRNPQGSFCTHFLPLLDHQAIGVLHIQLHQHCLSAVCSALLSKRN
jgi:hypothetical protein